ncbi:MAG: NADH-quinone oxidoreductase subunit NuoK [Bacteroidia bacterium]|nr:NADH-quinone oxidoreductase subunit NuoK [Bacteroidia bacterium]
MIQSTLLAGLAIFILGLSLFLTRRNIIMALMGIELMLNAANINFITFAQFDQNGLNGQVVSIFVMALAAAETAVALAIVLLVYRHFNTLNLDEIHKE